MGLAAGCGGKIRQFSADQVQVEGDGSVKPAARLYVTPQRIRVEPAADGGQPGMVMIFRRDQKRMCILMPPRKTYIEKELDENELEQMLRHVKTDTQTEELGRETVNGFACRKRKVTTETAVLGIARKGESIVWTSDRLDFPIRTQDGSGHTTELRNIKSGAQPARLFEVPKDYVKAGNLFEAMAREVRQPETPQTPEEPRAAGERAPAAREEQAPAEAAAPAAKKASGFTLKMPSFGTKAKAEKAREKSAAAMAEAAGETPAEPEARPATSSSKSPEPPPQKTHRARQSAE
jgi:hypothetical protein